MPSPGSTTHAPRAQVGLGFAAVVARGGGLTLEEVRVRVEEALGARPRRTLEESDCVPAAVLILLVERDRAVRLVFTKKTESVPHHKGQFAFPGGVVETFDASRIETALREAQEEMGLDPALVEVIGVFDDTVTSTSGFVITPVVGLTRTPPALRPDGREIERVVEIPLRQLLDPTGFHVEWWERGGREHRVVFFTCGEDVVWGVTGRILEEFLDAVFPGWRPPEVTE